MYAGGSFSNARPAGAGPGQSLMPRSNILAYNITTGVATSFAPNINGTVKSLAVSPDGRTLYVGGQFTQVNGQTRFNVAAFDTATGALSNTFQPAIGGSYVNAIVATNSTVYFGGLIGAAGGITRKNLAAASASNGAILGWAPVADLQVDAMVLAPGGGQGHHRRTLRHGEQHLLARTGRAEPHRRGPAAVGDHVRRAGTTSPPARSPARAGIWGLTTDGNGAVYGTGWVYGGTSIGNLEGIFSAEGGSGAVRWIADCHGDHYGVYLRRHERLQHEPRARLPDGRRDAAAGRQARQHEERDRLHRRHQGHAHAHPYVNSTYVDWSGYPAPAAVNWYPDWSTGTATGQGQAGWTVTGNGELRRRRRRIPRRQQPGHPGSRAVRARPVHGEEAGPAPVRRDVDADGPLREPPARRACRSPRTGTATTSNLTYELWAQGGNAPIATKTVRSTYWYTPTITFAADNIPAGSSRTYRVVARDGDGNSATSANVTLTVNGTSGSTYADAVLDDGATTYWRLGGPNGGSDQAGGVNATLFGGVGTTADDALANEANGAATFNGTSTGLARSSSGQPLEESFALELSVQDIDLLRRETRRVRQRRIRGLDHVRPSPLHAQRRVAGVRGESAGAEDDLHPRRVPQQPMASRRRSARSMGRHPALRGRHARRLGSVRNGRAAVQRDVAARR